MDPDFSILIGDKNAICGKKKGDSLKTLKIVVPTVLSLALVACILIVTYPKYVKIGKSKRGKVRKYKENSLKILVFILTIFLFLFFLFLPPSEFENGGTGARQAP